MNKKSLLLLLLSLSSTICLLAQSTTDTQLWLGLSVKKPLSNGFSITGQYRARRTDNISTFKGSYFYLNVDKKINKIFNIEAGYRLSIIDNLLYNRYAMGIEAQVKAGNHKFILRPMIQYQKLASSADIETSNNSKSYFRPRLTWKTDFTERIEFYASLEPFYKIDNNINVNWWQNTIGFKYETIKNLKLNPYFIWQPDNSHKQPRTNYILGLDIELNLKKQKNY
jgi:hypothetical protein